LSIQITPENYKRYGSKNPGFLPAFAAISAASNPLDVIDGQAVQTQAELHRLPPSG